MGREIVFIHGIGVQSGQFWKAVFKLVLLRLRCAYGSPGTIVKLKILVPWIWNEACDFAFPLSSQETPVLLCPEHTLSNDDFRAYLQYLYFLL